MSKLHTGRNVTLTFGGVEIKGSLTKDLEMTNKEKYIPKVGEECILQSFGFTEFNKKVRIDYIGEEVGCYTILENGKDYSFSISDVTFRPIPNKADVEREQLTRLISDSYSRCTGPDYCAKNIIKAGFTIPKKVKRSDIADCVWGSSIDVTRHQAEHTTERLCKLLGDLIED